VAGEDLWTTADIAQRLRISTERARLLSRREDFPAPVQRVRHFSLWRGSDVEAWLERGRQDR
jgi:predicted DNA-binding transcriptional regulator AlpA